MTVKPLNESHTAYVGLFQGPTDTEVIFKGQTLDDCLCFFEKVVTTIPTANNMDHTYPFIEFFFEKGLLKCLFTNNSLITFYSFCCCYFNREGPFI